MKSKVSSKGQAVIPKEIRKALGIGPSTVLHWEVQDGRIIVYPLPPDPVRAALGFLKGKGSSFQEFMQDRREERMKELAKDEEVEQEFARERGAGD